MCIAVPQLVQKENDLEYYNQLKAWKGKERKTEYLVSGEKKAAARTTLRPVQKRLEGEGFDTEQELDKVVLKIEASLKKSRAKELGEDAEEPAVSTGGPEAHHRAHCRFAQEPPSFPLVDIPDHQLDEESIKEKRRQRLLKAGYDARNRAKLEKEEEKRLEAEAARLDAEQRANDPQGWAQRARAEYEVSLLWPATLRCETDSLVPARQGCHRARQGTQPAKGDALGPQESRRTAAHEDDCRLGERQARGQAETRARRRWC